MEKQMCKIIILLLSVVCCLSIDIKAENKKIGQLVFEGKILAKTEHPGIACGIMYVHQVAKYKIESVLSGNYKSSEIVVDHPACDGDVFEDFAIGTKVKLSVEIYNKYPVVTYASGIREQNETPEKFYVAYKRLQPSSIDTLSFQINLFDWKNAILLVD